MTTVARHLRDVIEGARPSLEAITERQAAEQAVPDKWSLKQILGHLIDSAANNHQRIVRMQERDDIGRFSYAQGHWVAAQHYQEEPWQFIVQFWYAYNTHLVHVIEHVDPACLDHRCDMDYAKPASLRFVMEDYVRHVEHHLRQIFSDADPGAREQWVRREP